MSNYTSRPKVLHDNDNDEGGGRRRSSRLKSKENMFTPSWTTSPVTVPRRNGSRRNNATAVNKSLQVSSNDDETQPNILMNSRERSRKETSGHNPNNKRSRPKRKGASGQNLGGNDAPWRPTVFEQDVDSEESEESVDSEDEVVQPLNLVKPRMIIESCSDGGSSTSTKNNGLSSSTVTHNNQKKKKKKATKQYIVSSSESDGSFHGKSKRRKHDDYDDDEEEEEESSIKGRRRRNIRSIILSRDLQLQTRLAQEEERKRKERVAMNQKLFNQSWQLTEQPTQLLQSGVIQNVILDMDEKSGKSLVAVDPEIVKWLKPHQARGIKFMWDSCFESVEQYKKPDSEGSGCILAHCMGLGKTLQAIGLLHCVLTSRALDVKKVLILCPLNTVGNWCKELDLWLDSVKKQVPVHKLYESKSKDAKARLQGLEYWDRKGGIAVIHYDRFRELVCGGNRMTPKFRQRVKECLLDPGPDVVVCDEAHVMKNRRTHIFSGINQIKTKRRILLTGTPLQNNLEEYYTMMQFAKPNLLGSIQEFRNRFVNPITNGEHQDSTESDVRLMKKRAHVLHKLLDGCVQRLDYSALVPFLPPKFEYVVLIKLTDVQQKLYKHYVDCVMSGEGVQERIKQRKCFIDFVSLSKVCSHPYALKLLTIERDEDEPLSDGSAGSLRNFVVDSDEDFSLSSKSSADDDDDFVPASSDDEPEPKSGSNSDYNGSTKEITTISQQPPQYEVTVTPTPESLPAAAAATTPVAAAAVSEAVSKSLELIDSGGEWWNPFFESRDTMSSLDHTSKFTVFFEILRTCEIIGDKVLCFSQNLNSLNIIERFLQLWDEDAQAHQEPQHEDDDAFDDTRWRKNIEYFRIDGSTKGEERQRSCDEFNEADTSKAKLFLISTRAGGLGINLIGSNRVVILDASWNPSQDLQSIYRVYRFGQTKPCYIYRLIAEGTIEQKVYNRQVVKLSLAGRVVDERQIERHFKYDDIRDMYSYDFDQKVNRPTPVVPKDRLLADLLMSHKEFISGYVEHDSLLENQPHESLTEEERQAAWTEYETEKITKTTSSSSNRGGGGGGEKKGPKNKKSNVPKQQLYDWILDPSEIVQLIHAKIKELYPNLGPDEFRSYVSKVHLEVQNFKMMERKYSSDVYQLTPAEKEKRLRAKDEKKLTITKYLIEPGYLKQVLGV